MLETIRLTESTGDNNYFLNEDSDGNYSILVDMDKPFSEITDKKHIKDIIKNIEDEKSINAFDDLDEIYNRELEIFKNAPEDILKNVEYIFFDSPLDITLEYLKQNKEIYSKKIVLECEFDDKEIFNIKDAFNGKTTNIYLMLPGNSRYVSFEEAVNTLNRIEQMVKEIENKNFSPFEKVLATYDIVRNHEYISEAKDENAGLSRNLTDVLLGDKRVCTGFSHIMDIVLKKLGIETSLFTLDSINENENGHIRNMVNIIDPKYKINGVYFCDATWDCKRKEDDKEYLYSYRYFAKTYEQMKNYDSLNKLKDNLLTLINKDMIKILKSMNLSNIDFPLLKQITRTIRTLTYFDYKENIFSFPDFVTGKKIEFDVIEEKLQKSTSRFKRPIDARKVLEAISVVRSDEYLKMDDYKKIIGRSDIKFLITDSERLMMAIFSDVNLSDKNAVLKYILDETEKKLIKKL